MMKKICTATLSLILLFSLAILAGCQKASEQASKSEGKASETSAGYGTGTPSGTGLGKLIYEKSPYTKWALWPGKGKLSKGTEPHGIYITVYVNDKALESIKKVGGMVDNSIIIKENYNADKRLTSVTVMQKVKGYNPEGGDWFWVRFDPDSKVTNEGKVAMCIGCHTGAKGNDYIYTGKVTAQGPSAGAPGYGKPAAGYGAPGYGEKAKEAVAGYGEKAKEAVPGYGEKVPGYGTQSPGYGAPGYGEKAKEAVLGYGEKVPGYGTPGYK
jgi:hypothetical protein